MEVKRSTGEILVKDATRGLVTAVFATTGVVDRDDDYTLPSAFKSGQQVMISEWNHSAILGPHPPIGEGTIRMDGALAIVDAQLFMDIPRAVDMARMLKSFGPRMEWSYGFNILESGEDTVNGRRVRVLKELDVFEASPVWRGAGLRTQTLSAKDRDIVRRAAETVALHEASRTLERLDLHRMHLDLLGRA